MNTEDVIDTTIANLKVIGMVQKNGRLSIKKGQLTIEPDDHFQRLRRWFNKDGRDLTLMHIRNTVNNAIKLTKGMIENTIEQHPSLKSWALQRFTTELQNCQAGILNLKTTYNDDSQMVANLDVIGDRIQAHYLELSNYIKEHSLTLT